MSSSDKITLKKLYKQGLFICMIQVFNLFIVPANAQTKFFNDLKITGNYQYGVLIPEYSFISYIADDYIRSVDICFSKKTLGKNVWEQVYNYPEYGLSLFYSSLGNNQVFGKELALTYFFKVNIIDKKRFNMFNRTGIGVGYVNKVFDLYDNYLNVAIGSHFNIHFNFRLGFNYAFTNKMELNAGISFDHFSNAKSSIPNLGLNYVTAYTGIGYKIGESTKMEESIFEEHIKKNNFEIFTSIGGKYTQTLTNDYKLTSSLSFEYTREFFRILHLGTGIDIFYDPSIKDELLTDGKEYKDIYRFQSGIHISQELVYNRISIILQEGFYLLLNDMVEHNLMYTRGIVKYQISNKLSLRLSMKSHFHILDYPELGLGIKL